MSTFVDSTEIIGHVTLVPGFSCIYCALIQDEKIGWQ